MCRPKSRLRRRGKRTHLIQDTKAKRTTKEMYKKLKKYRYYSDKRNHKRTNRRAREVHYGAISKRSEEGQDQAQTHEASARTVASQKVTHR
jgi:hypothetical protein